MSYSELTCFKTFLNELASNNICNDFTQRLISLPNPDANYYLEIGDRWCCVESLIKNDREALKILRQFAFEGRDHNFSFSSGNLKVQYIPNEDFVDGGSAFVIFSLVGTNWSHVVYIKDELQKWEEQLSKL